jgi:hypothetical protein
LLLQRKQHFFRETVKKVGVFVKNGVKNRGGRVKIGRFFEKHSRKFVVMPKNANFV